MRALKFAGAAIAAVVAILALVAAIGIPSSFLTSAISDRVERETGYQLTIDGGAKVALWPAVTLTLNDVVLQDPRQREANNRFAAGRVEAEMTLSSLWSGRPARHALALGRAGLPLPVQPARPPAPKPPATGPGGGGF